MNFINVNGVRTFEWNPKRHYVKLKGLHRLRYGTPVNNFGDVLGPILVQAMHARQGLPTVSATQPRRTLFSVGSVMHFAKNHDVVWGTGVNGTLPEHLRVSAKTLDVRAVRGPLTRRVLIEAGIKCPPIYGDPALLMPLLLGASCDKPPKTSSRLWIPNLHDKETDPASLDSIDPQGPWTEVVSALCAADLVVTSSLHGLVICEAFGVPVRLIRSQHESMFKYEDYFEGTGRRLPKLPDTIHEACESGPHVELVHWDSAPMMGAFPSDLWTMN